MKKIFIALVLFSLSFSVIYAGYSYTVSQPKDTKDFTSYDLYKIKTKSNIYKSYKTGESKDRNFGLFKKASEDFWSTVVDFTEDWWVEWLSLEWCSTSSCYIKTKVCYELTYTT